MLGLKKTVHFFTLQYVKISVKTHFFAIDIPKKTNTFITIVISIIVHKNPKAQSYMFGKILNLPH